MENLQVMLTKQDPGFDLHLTFVAPVSYFKTFDSLLAEKVWTANKAKWKYIRTLSSAHLCLLEEGPSIRQDTSYVETNYVHV